MDDLLLKALEAAQKGQSYAFATIVESTEQGTPRKIGAKMVVLRDGSLWGTIGGGTYEKKIHIESLKAIRTQKPKLITCAFRGLNGQPMCGGQMKVFIDPFCGQKDMIICGAGHIAMPLSILGKMLNFKVTILDNRKEFASRKRFPHVDQIFCGNPATKLGGLSISPNSHIIIITHGHEYDFSCLKTALKTQAGYIGVIGSQAKRIKFMANLKKLGTLNKIKNRLKMPVGVDIGAQTPEEIAIAIVAEIITHNNEPFIGTEKFRKKSK